jgi:hypothetical protein
LPAGAAEPVLPAISKFESPAAEAKSAPPWAPCDDTNPPRNASDSALPEADGVSSPTCNPIELALANEAEAMSMPAATAINLLVRITDSFQAAFIRETGQDISFLCEPNLPLESNFLYGESSYRGQKNLTLRGLP